jgi:predicted dienelactone hydrolase
VAHAGHFDFLAPCPPALAHIAPPICSSAPGFDRAAFHQEFNRDVVAFFARTLNGASRSPALARFAPPAP